MKTVFVDRTNRGIPHDDDDDDEMMTMSSVFGGEIPTCPLEINVGKAADLLLQFFGRLLPFSPPQPNY